MKKRGKWSDPNLNDVAAPGGHLNPNWVEWLMNWPMDWTSTEPMPRSVYETWIQGKFSRPQAGKEDIDSSAVRDVQFDARHDDTPHRQESGEQLSGESPVTLQDLSREIAQSMVGSEEGEVVPILRAKVHIQPGSGDNMRKKLREQVSLGESWWSVDPADIGLIARVSFGVNNRVDRIRAIGNGQVPAVVRLAWETLSKPSS